MYVSHLRAGRVMGHASPKILQKHSAAVLIDADNGFAFPACQIAIEQAIVKAQQFGIACGNSPAAMPAAGGKRAILGTNPIATIFPRTGCPPISIDLSLSEVARGKLMVAAEQGESILLCWALDADGNPTTDPQKGLEGSMLAVGGTQGAMLALVVELLVTTLTGAHFGAEADTFFKPQGNQQRLGQVFIVIDPKALGGDAVYAQRIEALVTALLSDEGVRLPGQRRVERVNAAKQTGFDVHASVLKEIRDLC